MIQGTKFKAFRRSTMKPVGHTKSNPGGIALTCDKDIDGIITCRQMTGPRVGRPQPIQIFKRFFECFEITPPATS